MKKVLFLVNHDVVIYNFRLELVERLLADGHEVLVCSPYGERIDDLTALGCSYIPIEFSRHGMNPVSELKLLSAYKKIIKACRPDIIFAYTIKPNIYGAMAAHAYRVPFAANITGLGTAVENGGVSQKITVMLYKIAFRHIKRVFFQNTENADFFRAHHIAVEKAVLLPGSGVNLSRFPALQYPKGEKTEFAFISRIMKEKGIDQYLEMAEAIKLKYPDTEFHICGFCEQDYEARIRKMERQGIVVYHGMVRNIREILEKVHCTVHPTYYPEGMSNVLLESSACARPIITTDRSGCREIIEDGKNGYIVEQKNSGDLTDKVEQFLKLPWEEKRAMGIYGRKKVEKEFDRQIVVDAYLREMD